LTLQRETLDKEIQELTRVAREVSSLKRENEVLRHGHELDQSKLVKYEELKR
jgi:cell shape-determining protein MreC